MIRKYNNVCEIIIERNGPNALPPRVDEEMTSFVVNLQCHCGTDQVGGGQRTGDKEKMIIITSFKIN